MAGFCAKCGAPLSSNTGFCSSCGAPITPVGAVPMAVPPPQAGYAQMPAGAVPPPACYPVAPPTQSSGGALKIILIVIAVVVGLGVLAAGAIGYTAWRVSRSIHMSNKGDGMTLSVPGGTISAGDSVSNDADLGVPTYPGAVREKGGMQLNSSSASMVMAHFTTSDSPSQVVDFYKSKMGDETVAVTTGNNEGTVLNSGGDANDRIMVTVGKGSGDDAGKTTIVIMHSKKAGNHS
jgi:hypothetical protein